MTRIPIRAAATTHGTPDATGEAARALAALGHETRLACYRLLVRAGGEGLRVGDIGAHLGQAPSTLSHHLSTLVDAGLVIQERRGREVISRADYAAMQRLLGFLTAECCTGLALAEAPETTETAETANTADDAA